jgi:tryptophan-rich sensory protein
MKQANQWLVLVGFLIASFGVAAISGLATGPAVRDWYPSLAKPAWTPPSWVFGPAWTVLYALIAVSAWLVWRRAGWCRALLWYAIQLALNATWSPVFFGFHWIGLAAVNIILLWLAIGGTTVAFWKVTPVSGILFLPYLAWVTYAATLNIAIWRLNPH